MTTGVTILGSTGSVGISTLEVLGLHPGRFHVEALSAHRNVDLMFEQCQRFKPDRVVMVDTASAASLQQALFDAGLETVVEKGEDALGQIASASSDIVVCSIVGAAGLMSTLKAVEAGRKVLIANKEPLVMMGAAIVELAARSGATLIPLDSEHNAIFQCLPQGQFADQDGGPKGIGASGVRKILLTGSGGPFLDTPIGGLAGVTPEQACNHPNWDMGRKISVDSATMMNKGLELIEACALFGVTEHQVEIVIHPQSVIHSMVEYIDGTILAQMASPDMKIPIANALAWPERMVSGARPLAFSELSHLDFRAPDHDRFPALKLAERAVQHGGTLPAVMNAANEICVDAFLSGQIGFTQITELVDNTMAQLDGGFDTNLNSVLEADRAARALTLETIARRTRVQG